MIKRGLWQTSRQPSARAQRVARVRGERRLDLDRRTAHHMARQKHRGQHRRAPQHLFQILPASDGVPFQHEKQLTQRVKGAPGAAIAAAAVQAPPREAFCDAERRRMTGRAHKHAHDLAGGGNGHCVQKRVRAWRRGGVRRVHG